ncbi:hypothetical protein [Streptomyces sp. NPDC002057]|uniref:hypothetical protein n=1 Tax=Streptomyces sp. NPDC002057 TaxID=3154664 RepID=UPI00332D63BD
MTTSAPATGSSVLPVGPHLVIGSEETATALTAALGGLPPLPSALLVLAAAPDAAPVLRRSLPDLVALAVERGATRLVLAASGLAAPGPDGSRPVEAVATAADFTVIAPDGVVSVEPDGAVRLAEPGAWWLAEPAAPPRRLAAGWPPGADEREVTAGEPETEKGELAAGVGESPSGAGESEAGAGESPSGGGEPEVGEMPAPPGPLAPPGPPVPVVSESRGGAHGFESSAERDESRPVPGGLWLGRLPEAAVPLIGVGAGTFLVGVGSPGRPALPAAELLERAAEAVAEAEDVLVAAPWATQTELTAMAVAVAEHSGRTVRAAIGLPVRTADDHATTLLDERGAPTWQPLLLELLASPEHRRVVPSAWLRLLGPDATTPALHRCADLRDWALESVPAGLWLRPAGQAPDPRPRLLPPDPARPVLIVGDGERRLGPEVWQALPGVLDAVPDLGAPEPYGLLLLGDGSDEEAGRPWAEALDLHWLDPGISWPRQEAPSGRTSPLTLAEGGGDAEETATPVTPAASVTLDTSQTSQSPESAEGPGGPGPDLPSAERLDGDTAPVAESTPDHAASASQGFGQGPGQGQGSEQRQRQGPGSASGSGTASGPGTGSGSVSGTGTGTGSGSVSASTPAPNPGARSGPQDRAALRGLLGERYHILASKTELLASRLPSLRSTAQDDLKPDMVAIALYQGDSPDPVSRAGLAEAARSAAPGPFTPVLSCLASGLRRLPGHYGAVMLAAPAEAVPLDRYVPGAVLVEPAAVAAVPACDAELEGAVEFGIWSTTGRRTSVFLGTDDEPEVVFPPGTAFSVLALHLSEDDTSPIRVLLREVSPAEARSARGADDRVRERDAQARTRLTDWFERRDMLEPHDRRALRNASRFHVAPGAALNW